MNSIVDIYADIAKKNPPWTSEEESNAIKKWFDSDRERFIVEAMNHNMSLVFSLVGKLAFKKTEDMYQKSVIAMVEALRKFDPAKGFKISTWITQPIRWAIHHSQHAYGYAGGIADDISALNYKFGRKNSVVSLDAPIKSSSDDGGGGNLIENMVSMDTITPEYARVRGLKTSSDEIREMDIRDGVKALMNRLPTILNERELFVVNRLAAGSTMADIAVTLNVTRMRVSQISARAFEKIRKSPIGRSTCELLK